LDQLLPGPVYPLRTQLRAHHGRGGGLMAFLARVVVIAIALAVATWCYTIVTRAARQAE